MNKLGRLDKDNLKALEAVGTEYRDAASRLQEAVDAYEVVRESALDRLNALIRSLNEEIETAFTAVGERVDDFNAIVTQAAEWRDEIEQEMSDYAADRTEAWQESDAGQNYEAWHGEWESAELEAVDASSVPVLEEIGEDTWQLDFEMPDPDVIGSLPTEPER